jgi:pseudouridine-5'-phosphate glycosidase
MHPLNRATTRSLALESTLPALGLPPGEGLPFTRELGAIVRGEGAEPAVVGVLGGRAIVGLTDAELGTLLDGRPVGKANTANLGLLLRRGGDAATTVSTTMELAAGAGVRVFATGGIGGVHKGLARRLDISADLAAFTRFPVGVVASGTKSLLDVASTREALETLGVPVVGFRCDRFPAFYRRESDAGVDARFDDEDDLAGFLRDELSRTGRGVLICNPIPEGDELDERAWAGWLAESERRAGDAAGRDITPRVLAALHEVSGGATLRANLALVRSNARLGARLAARLGG